MRHVLTLVVVVLMLPGRVAGQDDAKLRDDTLAWQRQEFKFIIPEFEQGGRFRLDIGQYERIGDYDRLTRSLFWVSFAASVGAQTADLASSVHAERRGFHELNPLVRKRDGGINVPVAVAIMAASDVGSIWLYKRDRRWWAIVINILSAVGHAWAAKHNWGLR
jgi:hypothetical protein